MRSLIVCLAVLSVTNAVAAQPPADTFSVGTAAARPGQVARGVIHVPAGSDAATDIGVAVVRGTRPGPVLAIVAGAHGTEYASIVAVEKLIDAVDPSALSGALILVPLVNNASFARIVPHVNPVDGKSMNRFYPGNPGGTQTDRVSAAITREVVDRCDHLIDLHGGDLDESLRPYSYWTVTGRSKQDEEARQMVLAFGLDTIIVATDRPKDPNDSRYLDNTATTRGKASFAAEAGYAGTVDTDDVDALVAGSINVMRFLKMLPGDPKPVEHPVWIEQVLTVASDTDGLFHPLVTRGSYVDKGKALGYVTDALGRTILEPRAPAAGVVLFVHAVPSLTKGATVANIGVVRKTP